MAQRHLPVLPPQLLARPHLDGADHEIGAVQHGAAIGGVFDGQPGVPRPIHALGEPIHEAQPLGVDVDEGERAAAQRRLAQQRGERVEAEAGATSPDDNDLDRLHASSA